MILSHVHESEKNFKELLSKARKGRTAKVMIDGAEKLKAILREAETRGASPAYLERLKNDGRNALLTDIVNIGIAERERLTDQLEEVRKRWEQNYERDFELRSFRLQNLERRYASMSGDALQRVANDLGKGPVPDDPAQVDVLLSALNAKGESAAADALRAEMVASQYSVPWLRTYEGRLISQELKLNTHTADGAMIADAEGRTVGISLDELLTDEDEEDTDEI